MSRFAHPSESAQSLLPCHEFVLQLKSCTRAARFIRERKAEKEESVSVARFGCWRARIRRRVGQDVGGKGLDSPRCDCLRCTAIWRAPSKVAGLSGGTRTPDLLLRRQLLYPVELRTGSERRCQRQSTRNKARGHWGSARAFFRWNGRSGGIRTRDPLLPKQMRYQTALRSDETRILPEPRRALSKT